MRAVPASPLRSPVLPGSGRAFVGALAALPALGVAAVVATGAFGALALPAPLLVAAVCCLAAVVALALVRFDAAVVFGLALLSFVRVEPAPTDAVLAVVMAVAVLGRRPELRRLPPWPTAVVVVLLLANIVSMGGAGDPRAGFAYFSITLYLLLLAVWLSAYIDRPRRSRALLIAYAVAATAAAMLAILAVLTPLPGRDLFLLDGCCRAQGPFKDPNVFGPFLIPAVLMLLHELLVPRLLRRRARPILVAVVLVLVFGIVLSFSRGAWLNLGVGLGVMSLALFLQPRGIPRAATLVALLAVIAGVAIAATIATGETSFLSSRASAQSYDTMRFGVAHEGLHAALATPLGLGPGQFGEVFPSYPHNVYILVAAEQGFLGALAFIGLVVGTLVAAVRNMLAGRDTYGIGSPALLGAWCGLIASGLFVDTLHWRHVWLVAALVWAGSLRRRVPAAGSRPAPRRSAPRRPRAWILAPVAALLGLVLIGPGLVSETAPSRAQAVPADGTAAAGDVRFVLYPDSSFDRFVSPYYGDFFRQRYWRMRVYSPYFDRALSWYPDAWVYQDIQAIYPGSRWAQRRPDWILRDTHGRALYVPWGCRGGTCPQYAADIGNPAFRRAWLRQAQARLDRGYRGLYVDDVNMTMNVGDGTGRPVAPADERTGKPMTEVDWERYMAEFTEAIRRRFPNVEIVHNVVWGAGDGDPFIQREMAAADYINLERGVNDLGLTGGYDQWSLRTLLAYIDRIHARGGAVLLEGRGTNDAEREYNLAAYFLVSTGRDGVGSLSGGTPEDWWPGYDVHLGAPAGPRSDWEGLLRRDFERGTVLLNEPQAPTRVVDVGPGYTRIDGTPVRTLSLGPAQGAVLLRLPENAPAP